MPNAFFVKPGKVMANALSLLRWNDRKTESDKKDKSQDNQKKKNLTNIRDSQGDQTGIS